MIKVGVGLRINPEKIRAIWKWKALKIKKGVRVFLRFANDYRVFIYKFVITVAFFTVFIGKYPFFWIPEAQKAFES